MVFVAIAIGLSSLVLTYVYQFVSGLKHFGHIPGPRPVFSPATLLGAILPSTRWNLGHNWSWMQRKTSYFNYTHDVISMVPILVGSPLYYTCSVDVMKQLLGHETKLRLVKPLDLTLFSLWGDSLAASSGEIWRRHRRIVAPAFNPKLYTFVWTESAKIYKEMLVSEGWKSQKELFVPAINPFMLKLSLMAICRCGFGLPITWAQGMTPQGSLTFGEAITVASESIISRLILPQWAFELPIKKLRHIDQAWTFVMETVRQSIHDRRLVSDSAAGEDGHHEDILGRLVASFESSGKYSLDEPEIIANIFTMLFAGHETTSSTLSATLGCIALYPDEQDKAISEIEKYKDLGEAVPDINQFPHLQACFQEAARLYPAAFMFGRTMSEDVPIQVTHPVEQVLVLQKGSRIIIDLISIHRNPNRFEDPDEFRPSRWYGVSEPDLPMFGTGPRACVGRRFAHTEAVCFLFHLLRDWKLDIRLEEGETREEYKTRVMGKAGQSGTAFSVGSIPLVMSRRTSVR